MLISYERTYIKSDRNDFNNAGKIEHTISKRYLSK